MPSVDFAAMSYAETKGLLFRQLPPETATAAKCETALGCIDVLQVTRPSESEHAGTRMSTRDLDAMRDKFAKRYAVHGWNDRSFETVIATDDLQ